MKFLIQNIKNLFPYLLLIGIYFFFVNIEAHKIKNNSTNNRELIKNNEKSNDKNTDTNMTISIPVIPFEQ